jgi:hypothetical protein
VGIGTTSPAVRLQVNGASSSNTAINIVSTSNAAENSSIQFFNNTVSRGRVGGANDFDGLTLDSSTTEAAAVIRFRTGGTSLTERMRIDSSGMTTIGTYTNNTRMLQVRGGQDGFFHSEFNNTISSGAPYGMYIVFSATSPDNNTSEFFRCSDSTAERLVIYSDGDVKNHDNSYGGLSDAKLKQNIVDASSQWGDIKNLRVRKFKFKSDVEAYGSDAPNLLGLIAQEVELVSPGLVDESLDYEEVEVTDEEGNVTKERQATGEVTKSVKYSILYMKAVKALQEAMERIETLEAKVAALEAVPGNE